MLTALAMVDAFFLSCSRTKSLLLPLAKESVVAGFPSPAEDFMDTSIDLNEQLIQHPASTFFLRVCGNSMVGAGIHDGDLLIVDRSLEAKPGRIVIAALDGQFTVKRLMRRQGLPRLEAENPEYPPLKFSDFNDVQIWGVVMYSIHSLGAFKKICN